MAPYLRNLTNGRRKVLILFGIIGLLGQTINAQFNEYFGMEHKSKLGKSDWQQLFEDLPLYAPLHTFFQDDMAGDFEDSENMDTGPMFTEDEILLYKDVFKFLPTLTDTAFGDILEKGSIPSDFIFQNGQNLESILKEVAHSKEFETFIEGKVLDAFVHFVQHISDNYAIDGNLEDVEIPDVNKDKDVMEQVPMDNRDEEHNQEGDWEGCRRDYNALALPWTNGILARLATAAIERLIPEETFQCNPVCEDVCQRLTNLTLLVCRPACNYICSNSTYDGLVDMITSGLFPPIPKARWNRAMFDAMGKVPPALADGQLHWSGGYDRCLGIEVNYTYIERNLTGAITIEEYRKFSGQYLRIPFKPPLFQERRLNLLFGACVPSTCNKSHVVEYITEENDLFRIMRNVLNWTITEEKMFNGTHDTDISQQPGLIFLLIFMLITILLGILPATIYDIYFREGVMQKHVDKINKARQTYRRNYLSQMSYDASSMDNKKGPGQTPDGDTPDNYSHIHSDDYRRFSVSSDISNMNNNNGTRKNPVLFHSMSTQSTTALMDNYPGADIESEPASVWDRLEVMFVAFSGYSNMKRIFRIRELDTDLPALDCVRFLSCGWSVVGYTWVLGPIAAECWLSANVRVVLSEYLRSWPFQVVVNFHFSTDSFFVISGILVAYWWLKNLDGKELTVLGWVKTCLLFYLKRYWRIAPSFMMNLVFYSMTYKYLSTGPFAAHVVADAENCKVNWWSNMLMMHNIVNTDKLCLSWTWYLPALFQLLIMCPLILMPLVIKPLIGYIILAAVYVIHIAITAGVVGEMTKEEGINLNGWIYDYFFTPWCRAGAFFIGIAYGIVLYKKPKTYKMPKWFVLLGFAVSLVLISAAIYGTFDQFKVGGGLWDRPARVMYNTFARSGFSLGVGFIILICCTGNAGVLGSLLNWRVFQPLSRIVFLAYFMGAPLIFSHAYGVVSPIWITTKTMIHWSVSNMVIGYLVGIILTGFCVHYPFSLGIERMLRVKSKEDCIKAGRHQDIVELMASKGMKESVSMGNMAEMNNPLQRSVSMNAGYDTIQDSHQSPSDNNYETLGKFKDGSGFNRQDSTTSL